MTARLDQAAAELRRRAAAAGFDLRSDDVPYLLNTLVAWAQLNETEFTEPGRFVSELHWAATVIAVAGGHQAAADAYQRLLEHRPDVA